MSSINLVSSQLDVATIVDSLIYVDRAPARNMEKQVTALQSKKSAYQSLNTKLSALSDKVTKLLYGDGAAPLNAPLSFSDRLQKSVFTQCAITSSDEDKITATASGANISGNFAITVSSLARAESQASAGFATAGTTLTGTGTLTIRTGSNNPVTVTITGSNNTLSGVCGAINDADAGVTASLINDGSGTPYRLLITSNDTGTANSITVTDNLTGGQALGITQMQAATNAEFSINGVGVIKSSNTVSDVIDGVTFALKNETASPVNLHVGRDVDAIASAVKEFISAYNSINTFITGQFAYNSTTEKSGVLAGDPTLRSIQSSLQNKITQSITNRYTSYGVIGQVGLEFNRDGSLSLNEEKFRKALSSNFTDVAALFLGDGTPQGGVTTNDNRVLYDSKTAATQEGVYSLQVATLAEQAAAVGAEVISALSEDEDLTIYHGAQSVLVHLTAGSNITAALGAINTALSGQGMAITAANDGTDRIKISTNSFGSSENIRVVSNKDVAGLTGFGTAGVEDNGVDIAGQINGHAATGSGLMLTGAAGQPEEGLSISIAQTTTGSYGTATVASDTTGVEGSSILMNLFNTLHGITDPLSGPIHHATDGIQKNITYLNDAIGSFDERLETRSLMLTQQFNAADQALRLLQVTQGSLNSALSGLS
jgi:flagellar hook-associated protein 2